MQLLGKYITQNEQKVDILLIFDQNKDYYEKLCSRSCFSDCLLPRYIL